MTTTLHALLTIGGLAGALASTRLVGACRDQGVGALCSGVPDWGDDRRGLDHACTPRCDHATDCGDGYRCDADGLCLEAQQEAGDQCDAEAACAAGLACHLDLEDLDDDGVLSASCGPDQQGHALGGACDLDQDCRNGTCALGRCVDVCATARDCGGGMTCTTVPRVETTGTTFAGCLPSTGTLTWAIPPAGPSSTIRLAVPGTAQSVALEMEIDDDNQQIGATRIAAPSGALLYELPTTSAAYYANPIRHLPQFGAVALSLPQSPELPLEVGTYDVDVASLRASGSPGTAIPRVTAVARLGTGALLDVHFYFLDLADHPCRDAFDDELLDAASAATSPRFQGDYLEQIKRLLASSQIALGQVTYTDVTDHADLDGLALADADRLFQLSTHAGGVNVFFVRTVSPDGIQAVSPNPGAPGIAGSKISGIAIAASTLCYRSWSQVARLTVHEMARFMGLFPNRDIDGGSDPILDSDPVGGADVSTGNLMFYADLGGTVLSPGQQLLLRHSAVLR